MNITHKIKQLQQHGTKSDKTICAYFLSDYPFTTLVNLQTAAKKTKKSIPTVQRAVIKLGYCGYPDFRQKVLAELQQEKSTSPLSRIQHQENQKADKTATYQQTLQNIQATFAHLPPVLLPQVAHALADESKAVWCIGGRFTGTLATLFARHLKTIRHRVREFSPYEGALADVYADTDRNTVLFITDIRRYDTPIIRLCEAAKERQATIILVTDYWLSPAEKSADMVIPVYTNSSCGWDSNACLLVVLEEIMRMVTQLLGQIAQVNLQKREIFLAKAQS
ncbi:MAG: MurR/RpiR family transcriptional regulator [Ostreibacterium sp.]